MNARSKDTPPGPRAGEPVSTKLLRIAERARRDPRARFTSLFHLLNEELLRACFRELSAKAAPGVDEVTKAAYDVWPRDRAHEDPDA